MALLVPADFHSSVAARVQEDVDCALHVPAQDDGFFAHPRCKEIAGTSNEAFVADEQPRSGEHFVQLFLIDPGIDEDLATDDPAIGEYHLRDALVHAHKSSPCGLARSSEFDSCTLRLCCWPPSGWQAGYWQLW
jgi:hypothetical protein